MHPPRTLSPTELTTFLARISEVGPGPRLAAHFLLMTGCRLGEYLNLKWRDVLKLDFSPRAELLVRAEWTKTGHQRTIPLPLELQDILLRFLDAFKRSGQPLPQLHYPLWPGDKEVGYKARHLQDVFRVTGLACLNRVVTPHMLRHTYASNLLSISNTALVQLALGHKALSSTQIYLHPSSTDLAAATDRLWSKLHTPPR